MLTSKIEPEDYALIKKETEINLNKLEARITDVAANPIRVDEYILKAVNVISNISNLYQNADNEGKRAIIGSMYLEKLHFDGQRHRTTRVNEMIELKYLISSALRGKKRRARTDKSVLPTWVHPNGFEPIEINY
jgi:site-specific DNA recombinase